MRPTVCSSATRPTVAVTLFMWYLKPIEATSTSVRGAARSMPNHRNRRARSASSSRCSASIPPSTVVMCLMAWRENITKREWLPIGSPP